jgi:hypothetical protein
MLSEPFPSNESGIHMQTHRPMGGILKYSVEMGSFAMTYTPSFIKLGPGIQNLKGGIHRHTDSKMIS